MQEKEENMGLGKAMEIRKRIYNFYTYIYM